MRYYKAIMPRGHVGIGHSADITFYFKAKDIISAMNQAKKMGGVKHTKMPLNMKQITEQEYLEGRKENAYVRAMAK